MITLNMAVAREVREELQRQELQPKAVPFWLGVGDRKASALCKGETLWTMAELETVSEVMGVDLSEMLTRIADRLNGRAA